MNEVEKSILSKETRKKRRGSRFRYSSKKDLDRSRLKRKKAKAGGSELASVTKALSFPSVLSSSSTAGSSVPHCLERVEEHDGKRMEISLNDSFSDGAFTVRVSYIYLHAHTQ
jgi:hypothetical protein